MNGRWVGKALLVMLALGMAGCQSQDRNPFIFEIPAGYKGWVSVRFFEGSCPELPTEGETEGDKMLVKLPATGRLCTISPLGFGKAADEYYYVDASGNRTDAAGDIQQEHVAIEGASPNKQIYERFFVGTAEELKKSPEPHLE